MTGTKNRPETLVERLTKRLKSFLNGNREAADEERAHTVEIDDTEIVHRGPDGIVERVSLAEITTVWVETNDSGPWGFDVWVVIEGRPEGGRVAFPMGATGDSTVIERLFDELPGFQLRGMNSTDNARFECWPSPTRVDNQ